MNKPITDKDREDIRACAVLTYTSICACTSRIMRPSDPHSDICTLLAQTLADARANSGPSDTAQATELAVALKSVATLREQLAAVTADRDGFHHLVDAKNSEIEGLQASIATLNDEIQHITAVYEECKAGEFAIDEAEQEAAAPVETPKS